MMNYTLKDIPFSDFIDKEGKFKIQAFKLWMKEQSIHLRESLRNNDLVFQDFDNKQKEAIKKFIEWYYD